MARHSGSFGRQAIATARPRRRQRRLRRFYHCPIAIAWYCCVETPSRIAALLPPGAARATLRATIASAHAVKVKWTPRAPALGAGAVAAIAYLQTPGRTHPAKAVGRFPIRYAIARTAVARASNRASPWHPELPPLN